MNIRLLCTPITKDYAILKDWAGNIVAKIEVSGYEEFERIEDKYMFRYDIQYSQEETYADDRLTYTI